MGKKTSLYLSDKLSELLKKYAPRWGEENDIAAPLTIFAERYDELMRIERRGLRNLFTEGELTLMVNNALSTIYEPAGIIADAVLADTEDEGDENFEYYGVDRTTLLKKLRGLTPGQQFALVDRLEELREGIGKEKP